jgi:mgtE-like transporter
MILKQMLKQSLPLLILCGIGGVFTGSILGSMVDIFQRIPGLLVIIPGIIALRGNISTAFGSRLGSAYHLGLINAENMWNDALKQNVIGSLVLSILVSFSIGLVAYLTTLVFFQQQVNLMFLLGTVLIAGIASGLLLTSFTIFIIFLVFKRGYDPDNITGPALATVGDITTMLCIYAGALVMEVVM